MDIGIGLPGHAPWKDGRNLVEWARRAEVRGFSTLTANDRLLWTTPEPLTALAVAAGATSRIGLLTSILLGPLHTNHLLFAKSVLTLDHLAGRGRLVLGLAPGVRDDDFTASGVDYGTRGKQLDQLIERLTEYAADVTGLQPATSGGPPLYFGGHSKAALRRVATVGSGWIAGDATVEDLELFVPRVKQAWADAGREGAPRIVASVMFALGRDAHDAVSRSIGPYYTFAGEDYADYGIAAAYTDPERITAAVNAFEQAGCDELVFTGNDPNPDQVDLLADLLEL
jgi:alkanesulfonate monooxygenase SsuD/methylene tetrahydromethanopterin reductase-like flavin-dependent oxidoreductase (luciferase family)